MLTFTEYVWLFVLAGGPDMRTGSKRHSTPVQRSVTMRSPESKRKPTLGTTRKAESQAVCISQVIYWTSILVRLLLNHSYVVILSECIFCKVIFHGSRQLDLSIVADILMSALHIADVPLLIVDALLIVYCVADVVMSRLLILLVFFCRYFQQDLISVYYVMERSI